MQNATPDGPSAGGPPSPSSGTPVHASAPAATVSDADVVKRMYEESVESYEASITAEELAKPLYTVSVPRLAARASAAATTAAAAAGGDGSAEAAPPGVRILDVGCGPGHVLGILSRTAGASAAPCGSGEAAPAPPLPPPPTLIGVDLSPRMVARARARVPCATVVEGSVLDVGTAIANLPGGGAPFDGLACLFVLHHVGDVRAVLGAFRRLLRPGGAVLLASWVSADGARMEGYPEQWPIDAVAHQVEVVNTAAAAAGLRVDAVEETEDQDMGARFAVWECTAVEVEGI
ncbi:hypothetical protein MMPV_006206 [Pyropia vietnamensis]